MEVTLIFNDNYCICTKKRLLSEALLHYFP